MDKGNLSVDNISKTERSKRIRRMKRWIVAMVIIALLLPTIMSIIMFARMNSMQKQIDQLLIHQNAINNENSTNSNVNPMNDVVQNDLIKINLKEIDLKKNQNGSNKEVIYKDVPLSDETELIASNTDKIDNNIKQTGKQVYLTFDDGPSKYTSDILDLLAEYNVKASFFVIGKTDNYSKEMYRRIVEEGHSLGMHSYSHNYNEIYNSLGQFKKDFEKIRKLLYDTTGHMINIYRFPGGSGNEVSRVDMSVFIKFLYNNDITYFDWNVISGDATGVKLTPKKMYENVLNGVKTYNKSIVLIHDTDSKKYTVEYLRKILDNLTKQNVQLLPLDGKVSTMQQVKVSSIIDIK